jgi:hypothetical protein
VAPSGSQLAGRAIPASVSQPLSGIRLAVRFPPSVGFAYIPNTCHTVGLFRSNLIDAPIGNAVLTQVSSKPDFESMANTRLSDTCSHLAAPSTRCTRRSRLLSRISVPIICGLPNSLMQVLEDKPRINLAAATNDVADDIGMQAHCAGICAGNRRPRHRINSRRFNDCALARRSQHRCSWWGNRAAAWAGKGSVARS